MFVQEFVYLHVGGFLALASGFSLLLAFFVKSPSRVVVASAALAMCGLIVPWGETSFLGFLGASLGPVSSLFLTVCGFSLFTLIRQEPIVTRRDEAVFCALATLAGGLVMVSLFSVVPEDLLATGYSYNTAFAVAGLALLISLLARSLMTAIWIGAGGLLWLSGLTGSTNVWNVLVDPLGLAAAISIGAGHLAASLGYPVHYAGLRMSSRPPYSNEG